MLVEVGYIGSRGLKLQQNLLLNQIPDSALALRDDLRTQVANPFFNQISSGPLAQRTVARALLLRPYPHFDTVTASNSTWSSSVYHALTAKAEKRYAKGLTLMATYTYSKAIDYGIGTFAGEEVSGGGFQNYNNLRPERSVATLDQTHRLLFNAVFELPFFKNGQGFAGRLLGGWEIGVIAIGFTGAPLGMNSAVNNTFSQGGGQRPNWTGVDATLDNPTPQRWFDISQFPTPAAYSFGNSARTYSGLRSDSLKQLDLSLHKNTKIVERLNLQFRAEFFNLSNTPRLGVPNNSQGNNQFGVVSAMGNQPRIVQLALKLMF